MGVLHRQQVELVLVGEQALVLEPDLAPVLVLEPGQVLQFESAKAWIERCLHRLPLLLPLSVLL